MAQPRKGPQRASNSYSYHLFRRLLHRDFAGRNATRRQRALARAYGSFATCELSTAQKWMQPPTGTTWPNGAPGHGSRTPTDRAADGLQAVIDADPKAWPQVRAIIDAFNARFHLEAVPMGSLMRVGRVQEIASRLSSDHGQALAEVLRALDPDSDGGSAVTRAEAIDLLERIRAMRPTLNDMEARLRGILESDAA